MGYIYYKYLLKQLKKEIKKAKEKEQNNPVTTAQLDWDDYHGRKSIKDTGANYR